MSTKIKDKYMCKKCEKHLKDCICDLSKYTDIGDVSAVEFLDNHVKYHEGAGSPFYQGWAYKHTQMKFKLLHKYGKIAELETELNKLKYKLKSN